jgi:hypothetical protein
LCLCEKLFPALCIDEKTQFPGQQPHLYRHGIILLIVDVVEATNILWGKVLGKEQTLVNGYKQNTESITLFLQ